MKKVALPLILRGDFFPYLLVLFLTELIRGALLLSWLPYYAVQHMGLSLWAVGAAISAHYISDTLLKIAIGYGLDRFKAGWILRIGMIAAGLGLLLLPYSTAAWMLITIMVVIGIGYSPVWILCLGRVEEERRAEQMGGLYAVWLTGLGLGPVIMNLLVESPGATSAVFLMVLGALGIAASFLISETARRVRHESPAILRQWRQLWARLRRITPLLPGMILQTTAASMLVPILPNLALQRIGLDSAQYTLLLMVGGACAVGGMIPLGRWSDRFGSKWFFVAGFSSFAIGLFALGSIHSLWLCYLLAAQLGLSYAAVLPAWNALLAHYIPKRRKGMGWGVLSTLEGIGVMIGPVLGGWLGSIHSLSLPVWISAALFACIGLFYIAFPFPEPSSH